MAPLGILESLPPNPSNPYRLCPFVYPTHYDLQIQTSLPPDSQSFAGKVEIDLELDGKGFATLGGNPRGTKAITLHVGKDLTLFENSLVLAQIGDSGIIKSTTKGGRFVKRDPEKEIVEISFGDGVEIVSGRWRIGIAFESKLAESSTGYYRSRWTKADGSSGVYALTQFEPTYARRVFPCFDEPSFKATFTVSMIARSNNVVLGNMPVVSQATLDNAYGELEASKFMGSDLLQSVNSSIKSSANSSNGNYPWICTRFDISPKMSTYLACFATGEFEYVEIILTSKRTGREIPLRTYATPDNIGEAYFVAQLKKEIIPIYEEIFDIDYPLPKLDTLVASEFDLAAMENWGLITGRAAFYLIDPEKSSLSAIRTATTGQSHEVSHQWFGNIVTAGWWDNLWLNEAFATFAGETMMIDRIRPEWHAQSEFIQGFFRKALAQDSCRSSHPIEQPCEDPNMIHLIFDDISYAKGASVLRMLSNIVGEANFWKGVSNYLKEHLYGNTVTKDLWDGISQASGIDVAEIMKNWTLKVGFPIITVEETDEGLKLQQNRFLTTGDATHEEDSTLWHVPLLLKTVDSSGAPVIEGNHFLTTRETFIPLKDAKKVPYKLNAETSGTYRVRYPSERLQAFGKVAWEQTSFLSLDDRIGLVQDAFVNARSGYGRTSHALSLLKNFISRSQHESSHLVWSEFGQALSVLKSAWWEQPPKILNGLDKLQQRTFSSKAKEVGFDVEETDSDAVKMLRLEAVSSAAQAGDPDILAEVKRRFAPFQKDGDESLIPPTLRATIWGIAIHQGGEAEWEAVKKILKTKPTASHVTDALEVLGETPVKELQEKTYNLVLSEEIQVTQLNYLIPSLAKNVNSRRNAWEFLKANFDAISGRFEGSYSFGRVLNFFVQYLSSHKDVDEVEAFFSNKDTSAYAPFLKQAIEEARTRAGWIERDAEDVRVWLDQEGYLD